MLDKKTRYLQIAFNDTLDQVKRIVPMIPFSKRVLIEAGTPLIKREGIDGIAEIARLWKGHIVADLKTADGAAEEVELAAQAGASAATVMGSAPAETLNIFIQACANRGLDSMVDMIGVEDPLKLLRQLNKPPSVVVLHKGRDEETTRGKVIQYRHINRIRGKYDLLISAAGGVNLREAASAIFNGANIVVVNIVRKTDPWTGIRVDQNVAEIAAQFLQAIE